MPTEREHRAWHLAGHAYAATMCGLPVFMISLDGFTAFDLSRRGDAQFLDDGTIVRLPPYIGPVGSFEHTHFMEQLMHVAIAGPVAELRHRDLPCDLQNVQQFADDWKQAWVAAGFLWGDERPRLELLRQRIHSSPTVILFGWAQEFYSRVVPQLVEQGFMKEPEVKAAWDQMKAAEEASDSRPIRRRRPILCESDD